MVGCLRQFCRHTLDHRESSLSLRRGQQLAMPLTRTNLYAGIDDYAVSDDRIGDNYARIIAALAKLDDHR